MEYVNLGLNIPATLHLPTVEFIIVVIKVVTMEEILIGHKIPATLPLPILEQLLVVMVDMDIGLTPATLTLITQVGVVDCRASHFHLVLLSKIFMEMR